MEIVQIAESHTADVYRKIQKGGGDFIEDTQFVCDH